MKRLAHFFLMAAWSLLCLSAIAQTAAPAYTGPWAKTAWWPKVSNRATSCYIEVDGAARLQMTLTTPTAAEIKTGVAPDAIRFVAKASSLRDRDQLVLVCKLGDIESRMTPCSWWTGDPYNARVAGAKKVDLIDSPYGISPFGQRTGVCVLAVAGNPAAPPVVTPPVVVPPVVVPPVVTPPASTPATWVEGVREGEPLGVPAGTLVRLCYWDTCTPAKPATAAAVCSVDFFGSDPAPGKGKSCWVLK